MPTVKELFERMPQAFDRTAVAGLTTVIEFDITGEGGGTWQAAIANGELRMVAGASERPDLTITASARDYVDISTGALNEMLAFMTGRITAKGDLALAMKLPKIFKR